MLAPFRAGAGLVKAFTSARLPAEDVLLADVMVGYRPFTPVRGKAGGLTDGRIGAGAPAFR
jgi:hypothetical protein